MPGSDVGNSLLEQSRQHELFVKMTEIQLLYDGFVSVRRYELGTHEIRPRSSLVGVRRLFVLP